MDDQLSRPCTAFDGHHRIASGPLGEIVAAVKSASEGGAAGSVLTFDDGTGKVVDLDTRGTLEDVLARLGGRGGSLRSDPTSVLPGATEGLPAPEAPRGRGRPRLGVVPREVTLLPRHWEWLNAQPGGASVALRKLVEAARQSTGEKERSRLAKEAAYRFMSALAGDCPGFEEALRALFASHRENFEMNMRTWPPDVRTHALRLALPGFGPEGADPH